MTFEHNKIAKLSEQQKRKYLSGVMRNMPLLGSFKFVFWIITPKNRGDNQCV